MKILGLEFSGPVRSTAVAELSDDGQLQILAEVREADFRGVTGMMLVDRSLQKAGITPGQVEMLTVGLGPGSYTGIRSAIAIAQGWQLAREVPLIGIYSIESIAAEAHACHIYGEISIVVDAQRQEVYLARYRIDETSAVEIEPLRIAPPAEATGTVIGPEARRLTGGGTDLDPTAAMLCRLAMGRSGVNGAELQPIYLRPAAFVKAPPARLL